MVFGGLTAFFVKFVTDRFKLPPTLTLFLPVAIETRFTPPAVANTNLLIPRAPELIAPRRGWDIR